MYFGLSLTYPSLFFFVLETETSAHTLFVSSPRVGFILVV